MKELVTGKQDFKILMVGLDSAGKTTILYKLKLNCEEVFTIPTIGFNVETLKYKNITFTCWDVGGQQRLRKLWMHYYELCHAVIFVVDAADVKRLPEAKEEIVTLLKSDELHSDAILLVFANKQDLEGAVKGVEEMAEQLGLSENRNRAWRIQPCSAVSKSNDGIYDGLDWLARKLKERHKPPELVKDSSK